MTVPVLYANEVRKVLDHLEKTQLPAIETAADACISALLNKGALHCSAIGHGNEHDFLFRAGGLAAFQVFSFNFTLTDPVAKCLENRPRTEPFDRELETIRLAVKAGNLRAGDVMLVSSVSGRNKSPVEMALSCRALGLTVIAFTSLPYSMQTPSAHPSGKRLFEVADIVIDIGAPYGDAAVDIPGYDFKLLPVSGAAMIVAGWMIWGRVMEKMAAAGTPPTVFMSVNREGGGDYTKQAVERFHQRGY